MFEEMATTTALVYVVQALDMLWCNMPMSLNVVGCNLGLPP